jgi:hypothetical protein
MNQKLILMAAVAVGAVLFLNKTAAAQTAGSKSAPIKNININDQLFTSTIGGGWTNYRDALNPDGSPAFLMKNSMGVTVNSEGVPVADSMAALYPIKPPSALPDDLYSQSGGLDYTNFNGLGF